jgi:hypothetical protein
MFWHSLTPPEQDRLVSAIHFELGKVESMEVRHRMIHEIFNRVDHEMAKRAAAGVGVEPPTEDAARPVSKRAPEVSVEHQKKRGVKTLKVAVLAADGVHAGSLEAVKAGAGDGGRAEHGRLAVPGTLEAGAAARWKVDKSYVTTASVMFDAVLVPGGRGASTRSAPMETPSISSMRRSSTASPSARWARAWTCWPWLACPASVWPTRARPGPSTASSPTAPATPKDPSVRG